MKTRELIAIFGTLQAIGDLFDPPISRSAICQWGNDVPELRQYQLRERVPNIDAQIAALKKNRRYGKEERAA